MCFSQLTSTEEDIQEVIYFVSKKLFNLPGKINQVLLNSSNIWDQYQIHYTETFDFTALQF